MRSIVLFFLQSAAFTAALAGAAGCNSLIGAEEPEVVQEPAGDDDDGEAPGEAEALCGNGVLDADEECDDGNTADDDGCASCVEDCGGESEVKNFTTHTCYLVESNKPSTWEEAKAACAAWGGTLAALTSVDEFAFVQQRVHENTWIGGFDTVGSGSFEWVTGEPWMFESWSDAHPSADGHASCVLIDKEFLAFMDEDCAVAQAGFACERPPDAK